MSGIQNVILKQYDQKTVSEYNNSCPSFIDQYWANFADATISSTVDTVAVVEPIASNPLSDSFLSQDDILKRGAYPITFKVGFKDKDNANTWTVVDKVADTDKSFLSVDNALDGRYVVQCTLNVDEPILGIPLDAFSNSGAALLGISRLEIKLGLNDCKNIWNDYGPIAHPVTNVQGGVNQEIVALAKAGQAETETFTRHPLGIDTSVRITALNIHDSQYGKLKAQNTFPLVEYTALVSPVKQTTVEKSTIALPAVNSVISNHITLGSIPDKFYIQVRVPYADQNAHTSNFAGFPITKIKVTMNNEGGILNDRDQHELYLMSKKNGCNQSWSEFSGKMVTSKSNNLRGIGSYLVIDPVFDLNLSDMLSSGSLGTYSFQCTVEFESTIGKNQNYELLIVYTDSALFSTKQGASSMEKSYLVKEDVFGAKNKDGPSIDYQQFTEEMSGGRRKPMPLTAVGDALGKTNNLLKASKSVEVSAKVGSGYKSAGSYNLSGGAKTGIDQYL